MDIVFLDPINTNHYAKRNFRMFMVPNPHYLDLDHNHSDSKQLHTNGIEPVPDNQDIDF